MRTVRCVVPLVVLGLVALERRRRAGRPAVPRIALGFRDGSSTDLDPASAPARALRALADELTSRG